MFLLLDLSQYNLIHLAWFDEKTIEHKNYEGQNNELLFCIDQFLINQNSKKEDVKGIMVVIGAGTFTNTRIATTVANSFAYASKIPLLAISLAEAEDVQKLIPKLLVTPKGQYISATYSGEPNITCI